MKPILLQVVQWRLKQAGCASGKITRRRFGSSSLQLNVGLEKFEKAIALTIL
ncbi:MAG: hypothetical protein AAF959_02520 [Cyanobacteria bacterium P01_D01_bin.56]